MEISRTSSAVINNKGKTWIGDNLVATTEWWNSVISRQIPITRTEMRDYLRIMEKTGGIVPYGAKVACTPYEWKSFLDAWIKTIYRGGDVVPSTRFLGGIDFNVSPLDQTQLIKYLYTEAGKKYSRKVTFEPSDDILRKDMEKYELRRLQEEMMRQMDMMKPYAPLKGILDDPMLDDIIERDRQQRGPNFNRTPIKAPPPPPTEAIIQFIGGPKNAEQEYYTLTDHPYIQAGATFLVKLEQPPVLFDGDNLVQNQLHEVATYKLTFIPMSETSFSDAQIVIGIFQ